MERGKKDECQAIFILRNQNQIVIEKEKKKKDSTNFLGAVAEKAKKNSANTSRGGRGGTHRRHCMTLLS